MKRMMMTHVMAAAVLLVGAGAEAQSGTTPGGSQGGSAPRGTQGGTSSGPTTPSTGGAQTRTGNSSNSAEHQFVQKMLMTNKAEIELGQLGVSRATNAEVKSFAQMMVDEHTKANQQLMPVAQQLGISQPAQLDAKHKSVADRLSKASGAQFDQQFMTTMVQGHNEALQDVRKMAGNSNSRPTGTSGTQSGAAATGTSGSASSSSDSAQSSRSSGSSTSSTDASAAQSATEYAAATAPKIQQHLQQAQQIQTKLGK